MKDTYNLLSDGIVKLVRALAKAGGEKPTVWAAKHDVSRYFSPSIKGTAEIDWRDKEARGSFLSGIGADARILIEVAKKAIARHGAETETLRSISSAAALLCTLLI